MSHPDSIRWPGLVAAVCMLALAALESFFSRDAK